MTHLRFWRQKSPQSQGIRPKPSKSEPKLRISGNQVTLVGFFKNSEVVNIKGTLLPYRGVDFGHFWQIFPTLGHFWRRFGRWRRNGSYFLTLLANFRKNTKKVCRKRRALPVTKIYMPDFRHAHTLQQSEWSDPNDLSFGVWSFCSVLWWRLFNLFRSVSLFIVSVKVTCCLSRPGGVLENKVRIVVVCGHDESPAYISWLRAEPFFFWTLFSRFFQKWRKVPKSMTHFQKFDPNRLQSGPESRNPPKSGPKSTHGRAGGSFYVDHLGIIENPTKSDPDFRNFPLWPTFGPLCTTFLSGRIIFGAGFINL